MAKPGRESGWSRRSGPAATAAAPQPLPSSQPSQPPQPGVVTYTLVETKLNFDPNDKSFTTTNGRITKKDPNYAINR